MIDPDESRPPKDGLFDPKSPESDVRAAAPTVLEREGKAGESAEEPSDPGTTDALRHLGIVAATLIGMIVATYVVPSLQRYSPWRPGEPLPLSSLVTPADDVLPGFAGTGNEGSGEGDEDALEELGVAAAASVVEDEAPPPRGPRVQIEPREYAGLEIHLEHPESLTSFYRALERTAIAPDDADGPLTRIAHYGDSSIATDLITSTVRRRLQRRFGDGGHGFVLISKGYLPYRHRDLTHRSSHEVWSLREITRNHLSSGRYGFGGIQFRGRPGSWASFGTAEDAPVGTSVGAFEIWYQAHPRGGRIRYRLDDGEWHNVETRTEEVRDAIERIEVPDGPHELDVRFGGNGQPRLYGVVLERRVAGVVYDSLGLVGARAPRLLNFDAEHISGQLGRRGTHLLVLGFGGNEASDNIVRERYFEEMRSVIRRMRGGNDEMACLIVAPLDQAERDQRGRIRTIATIPDIVAAQRDAAAAEGCAFFDTWQAMGGEGAMRSWYRARPRLSMSDFRHATPAGYEIVGNLIYKALLEGFAGYVAAPGSELESETGSDSESGSETGSDSETATPEAIQASPTPATSETP